MSKFSLRDVFAVVTIVALALGWWLDHRHQKKLWSDEISFARWQAAAIEHELNMLGWHIGYREDGYPMLAFLKGPPKKVRPLLPYPFEFPPAEDSE